MERTFFSRNGAIKFMFELKDQGFDPELWQDRDAFNQEIFIVKW